MRNAGRHEGGEGVQNEGAHPIVHFEFISEAPERIIAFYERVFGWKAVQQDASYWRLRVSATAETRRPLQGAIARPIVAQMNPPQTVNTISTKDLEATMQRITAAGGTVVGDVMHFEQVGSFVYCADPEGRLFGCICYDIPRENLPCAQND